MPIRATDCARLIPSWLPHTPDRPGAPVAHDHREAVLVSIPPARGAHRPRQSPAVSATCRFWARHTCDEELPHPGRRVQEPLDGYRPKRGRLPVCTTRR